MKRVDLLLTAMVIAVIGSMANSLAGEPCCSHCGQHAPCQKICRLVCEEKKVEVVCWGCKCEDFCLGCPSQRGCQNSECVCEPSGDPKAPPCVQTKDFVWTEWFPTTAKMYTKKKLMKKVVTKKIPSFKWVVEDLCQGCEGTCVGADIPKGSQVPVPPVADARLIYGRLVEPAPDVIVR